jgi:integrase
MAHKVSAGGSYRLDKRYSEPVGRLAIATGATTRGAFQNVVACCDRLAERGRLDVLGALKARHVTIAQVLDSDRRGALDDLLASLTPRPSEAALWPAVWAWLGEAKATRVPDSTMLRYATSWTKLERSEILAKDARVSALAGVDWPALMKGWGGSFSDWNHLRRAVSRFLTLHFGDKFDATRRTIVSKIPKRPDTERVPDLDVPTFWNVVNAADEKMRPAFVTIVALGLRVGEYLRLAEHHLHPITRTVSVPGTKTAGSSATMRVDPEMWPWIVAAVPAPGDYYHLRAAWKRALKAAEADVTLRLHDLRHLTAQLLVNAGQSEASVQTTMRHATASMTRRYAMQRDRGENAAALARVLLPARTA